MYIIFDALTLFADTGHGIWTQSWLTTTVKTPLMITFMTTTLPSSFGLQLHLVSKHSFIWWRRCKQKIQFWRVFCSFFLCSTARKSMKSWCILDFFPSLAWPWLGLTFNVGHIHLNYKNPGQFDIFSSMSCRDLVTPSYHSIAQTTTI